MVIDLWQKCPTDVPLEHRADDFVWPSSKNHHGDKVYLCLFLILYRLKVKLLLEVGVTTVIRYRLILATTI